MSMPPSVSADPTSERAWFGPTPAEPTIDVLARLGADWLRLAVETADPALRFERLGLALRDAVGASHECGFRHQAGQLVAYPAESSKLSDDGAWTRVRRLTRLAVQASAQGAVVFSPANAQPAALAVPVFVPGQPPLVWGLEWSTSPRSLREAALAGQLASAFFSLAAVRGTNSLTTEATSTEGPLDLAPLLPGPDDPLNLPAAARRLAEQLRTRLGREYVAIAWLTPGRSRPKLLAVTGLELAANARPQGELTAAIEAALAEAVQFAAAPPSTHSPTGAGGADLAARPCLDRVGRMIGLPDLETGVLRGAGGRPLGGWLAAGQPTLAPTRALPSELEPLLSAWGTWLSVVEAASAGALTRLWRRSVTLFSGHRRHWALAGAALLCCALAVPVPQRVACRCVVEPHLRRFVAAPFAGRLAEVLVRPGDRVQTGDVLARMDEHELELEQESLTARRDQSRRRYESALARRDAGEAQVALAESRQAEAELELVARRQRELEVTSPTDGVVLVGDQRRAVGAPLEVGQRLFEVAPLDELLVEVEVPESRIGWLAPGLPVELLLDGGSAERLSGTIERIHPRAEWREERSVYVAEVRLPPQTAGLWPGLSGRAWIRTGARPLAWQVVERPWWKLRAWTGL